MTRSGYTKLMPSISIFLVFFWYLYTSQLLCSAIPIVIEMTHSYPSTGETVQTKIKIDDNLVEKILQKSVTQPPQRVDEATNTPKVQDESSYDYYDLDCAMPIMPELIHDEEQKETLTTRQTKRSNSHTIMDSIVEGLNGIAMNVAAAGIGVYNFFRPS